MNITKILEVVDTRQWEEVSEEVFKAIPGSGESHTCDRCGRSHEVHAVVELENGTRAIVGTSCMKETHLVKSIKSMTSTVKTIKKLEIQLARAKESLAKEVSIRELVDTFPVPAIEIRRGQGRNGDRTEVWCGDACVWTCERVTEERVSFAVSNWKSKRIVENGGKYSGEYSAKMFVNDLEKRIAKLSQKLCA